MSTSTIDFSKYATPEQAGSGAIDFGKYAASHEPGAAPDVPISLPPTPPSTYDKLTASYDPGAQNMNPVARGLSALGGTVLGTPGAIYHAVADPLTSQEQQEFQGHTRIPGEVALERLTGAPLVHAAQQYADPATRPTFGQVMSVLPEALGTGAGTVVGGELAGRALGAVPSTLSKTIPSLTRSGNEIGALRQTLDPTPVTGKLPSYVKATALVEKWDRTNAAVPTELRGYVERVQSAAAGKTTLTFQDLWEAHEALNDLKFDKNLTPKRAAVVGDVAKELKGEIQSIAERQGVGKPWQAAQSEYARGKSMERFADEVGGPLGAAAGLKYGAAVGEPLAASYFGGQIGRYVGKPVVGGLVRSILKRDAGPPGPPTPFALPSLASVSRTMQPREEYMRQMLRAKNGEISPTRLDQMGIPKMRRIPQPPEEP